MAGASAADLMGGGDGMVGSADLQHPKCSFQGCDHEADPRQLDLFPRPTPPSVWTLAETRQLLHRAQG
jgi:hypothetical protein